MVLKKHKNPKGGLNEAGRKHFEAKDGGNLKSPVKRGKNPRRVSFACRFAGMKRKTYSLCTSIKSMGFWQ
jgi:hypothetical protein